MSTSPTSPASPASSGSTASGSSTQPTQPSRSGRSGSALVRPLTTARITAAVINAALAVAALVIAVPALYHGAHGAGGGVPFAVNIEDIALGTLGLAGSAAVLRRQRWGTVLVIVVRAIDGVPSILGVITPEPTSVVIEAAVSVVGAALVIYLLLRRQPS